VTASAQRGSILDIACTIGWLGDLDEAAKNLTWVRGVPRRICLRSSAGVPVPGEAADGAFINHPDIDLADLAR
jgi:aclacinomycin oxidase